MSQRILYAFPPFRLTPRVLDKIIQDKAEGIVIVPKWLEEEILEISSFWVSTGVLGSRITNPVSVLANSKCRILNGYFEFYKTDVIFVISDPGFF